MWTNKMVLFKSFFQFIDGTHEIDKYYRYLCTDLFYVHYIQNDMISFTFNFTKPWLV